MDRAFLILAAFFLDLILGDPRNYPHPVRAIGWCIRILEGWLRRVFTNLYLAGVLLGIAVAGGSFIIVWCLVHLGSLIHPWLGMGASCFLIYTAIAMRDLDREAKDVYEALVSDDIPKARRLQARIVGRDTEDLSPPEIVRATVESVAENTVDGITSPLFYACLGGAPLAMAFKAASTLDSMIGYRVERYRELGWFSARMDDLMNFVPARITGAIIPMAALVLGMEAKDSLRIMLRDRGKTPSPNAGIPEAAFAGALGIALGGVSFYRGRRTELPAIGDGLKEREPEDILRAIRLMYAASFFSLGTAFFILFALL
ncbi:MAG: cobalamin biosynthesis protein CobD [Deltaproteobacteria bacterium]|nr:cobalamin biosynthesis protein CobD [Deltaproteobacteria bacterium]